MKLRKKINDFILNHTLNIDKLMTDKVEDFKLLEEQPFPINIKGKDGGRIIFIGNFTLENNYKFWEIYGKLIANLNAKIMSIEIAEERRKELLNKVGFEMIGNGGILYEMINEFKFIYKGLVELISKTVLKQQAYYLNEHKERTKIKWKNCSYRYFKKWVTVEQLIEICYGVYLYNFDAEKKNLQIITKKMITEETAKQAMENYMYFWLQNLGGLTGKFQLSQLTNVDYWDNEQQREIKGVK